MRPCKDCIHRNVCIIKNTEDYLYDKSKDTMSEELELCSAFESEHLKSNAQECLDKIKDTILGKDWYIVDPVSGNQGNEILTNEIISSYKSVPNFIRKIFRGW